MTTITLPGFGLSTDTITLNVNDIERFGVINMLGAHGTEIVLHDGSMYRTGEYSFRVHEQLLNLGWRNGRSF